MEDNSCSFIMEIRCRYVFLMKLILETPRRRTYCCYQRACKRSRAKICRGIKGKNMDNTLIEKQLKAAADLNDIKLLECMKNGEVCVCDFVDVLGISQQR